SLDNKLNLIPTKINDDGAEVVIFDEEIVKEGSKKWELTVCGHFACSFMLCDLDFKPSSLSLSSMPSYDLESLTNMLILLHYLESFKSELAKVFVFKS
ncbi:hypothetical protein Tco_0250325, partial [Tanacetum coccineum]